MQAAEERASFRPTEQLLTRALRPIAEVRPDEIATAGVMTLVAFILMSGYYLLKTAREPLILLQWGAENKLYAEAGQALILLVVVRAYSAIARRVGRMRLLAIVYLFFASNMVLFAFLSKTSLHIGLAFFLWVGIFSYTSIAQFWAFAADIYTEEQGRRIFALVGVGSSVGSVAGSLVSRSLVNRGPQTLMLGAAAMVVACVGLLAWVDRRSGAPSSGALEAATTKEPVAGEARLRLIVRDKYLILIGALTLALNCVSGLGDYMLDRMLLSHVASLREAGTVAATFVGSFKASFFAWYNLLAVLVQLFAVSRILTHYGVRAALLVLPFTAVLGYGAFAALPALSLIRAVVIANRCLDYSLTNTARHALFLVASRTEKYVGKTFVDTVGARTGDLLSAAIVWVAIHAGAHPSGIAATCVVIACAWSVIVWSIGRENARRLGEGVDGPTETGNR